MNQSNLPVRPSLVYLRKQAKKLGRDIAAGKTEAVARARAHLPEAHLPLSHRDAQLVLAREYGFPGWKDLVKEVELRLGRGLEWAVSAARHRIHDNDVDGLRQLLQDYPALLSWKADEEAGGLLGFATSAFGDAGDAFREERFTRKDCAEFLLDAGAVVTPQVCDGIIRSRAKGLIDLFHRRQLLPQTLKFLAARGDADAVRARLETGADDLAAISEAFAYACHFGYTSLAQILLDRSILLDPELGRRIDGGPGRVPFIRDFRADFHDPEPARPWEAYAKRRVLRAMDDGDLAAFVECLRSEAWLLSGGSVKLQMSVIEQTAATTEDRSAFLRAFLDLHPEGLRSLPPPSAGMACDGTRRVYVHVFTYAQTRLLPMLLDIWPIPDDLPHASGSGDLARVKRWFDANGKPALGELNDHFPAKDNWIRANLQWGRPNAQQVLDTAFAWAVMNNHFAVADFLLEHGADINTDWSSHEPASILHELVWHKNYEAMQFLIDRGIDMTTVDYRWEATAQGWARYAANDDGMAQWLAEAERRRGR